MRYLLLFLLTLTISCAQTTTQSSKDVKYHYDQVKEEKVEQPDKVNMYFVRPYKHMWWGYTAYVGVGKENVGGLGINETGKVFIDEGIHKVYTANNVDALTKFLTSDQTFTTRFEKGKNYYFVILPSLTKVFVAKPITRTKYLRYTKKAKDQAGFTKTLNTAGKVMKNMQRFPKP